jgi:hypothetical protein
MQKCLDITLALENGYRSRNFCRTGSRVVADSLKWAGIERGTF